MNSPITVFISYSWEDEIHNTKVHRFVERLRNNDIQVLYDRDMSLGERFTDFMEMINKCDYVLFLCTPTYQEKADSGVGGVKFEKNIITVELYEKGNERKFIPVLFSGIWNESLPIWAKGKLGIDYREESDKEFIKLLDHFKENAEGNDDNVHLHKRTKEFYIQKKSFIWIICTLCLLTFGLLYYGFFHKADLKTYEHRPYELINELDGDLRKLLGDKFEYFAECFYTMGTIGESTWYEDGIFIRGFVPGIASYMGGVLCVDIEGYIYVLLIDGEEEILYYTNNNDHNSSLPLTKFNRAISDWLADYSDYNISFKNDFAQNISIEDIEGIYVREYAQLEVVVNDNNTITITGEAFSGANMGFIDDSVIEFFSYPEGGYAKYYYEGFNEMEEEYLVFYFSSNSVSVLDKTSTLSGAGVSFMGEYKKLR